MASNQPSASGSSVAPSQEFIVRAPRNPSKKLSIMKFNNANKVDFAKCGTVKLERENNLRQYKVANDLEMMPKFGGGSEFGREQKEEARRKKYGVIMKRYNPEDQPWIMKTGQGKQTRRFRGTREGGITENTSYFIFTQCPDGAFEAVPVSDWYTFNPVINYRHLTMEEAEEEFERRDKTLNFFSIMVKKRIKNEDVTEEDLEEGEKDNKNKSKKKKGGFMLMDKDDWTDDEEGDDDDDDDDKDNDDEDQPKKKKNDKKKKSSKKPVKNSKKNEDDEAIEESDEGDYDDKEVDYITDSESTDDSDLDILGDKYLEQGVVDEDGLRKLNESGESEEEEENEKKPEEETNTEEKKDKPKTAGSNSSSSSETSDSDDSDDLEQDSRFLFMGGGGGGKSKKDSEKKKKHGSNTNSASNSRSPTPTASQGTEEEKAKKRKLDADGTVVAKKPKVEGTASSSSFSPMGSSDGITEENIRRYLSRKPMTTKDLLQKFRSKKPGESKEKLVTTVAQLLKRINPERTMMRGKMYLHLKKQE